MSACKESPAKHKSLLAVLTNELQGKGQALKGAFYWLSFLLFCAGILFLNGDDFQIFGS